MVLNNTLKNTIKSNTLEVSDKNIELAKFRRNLVINNLLENSYIDKTKYNEIINTEIVLRKRKKTHLFK